MNLSHATAKFEDSNELSLSDLDHVTGGNPANHGRGDGLGKLRDALGGGILGEVATVIVQGVRGVGRALGL